MDDCKHEQVFDIGGKTSDMCSYTFPNGKEGDGYVPQVRGIYQKGGGGDYFHIRACLGCKQILGFEPQDVLDLQNEVEEE